MQILFSKVQDHSKYILKCSFNIISDLANSNLSVTWMKYQSFVTSIFHAKQWSKNISLVIQNESEEIFNYTVFDTNEMF